MQEPKLENAKGKKLNRKEKLAIVSFCMSLAVIGIAVWRLTHMEVVPFTYSIDNLKFNGEWFNFTINFIELPKAGITVDSCTVADATQNFAARTFYSGDTLTFNWPLAEPISELPQNLKGYLRTKEIGILTIQITQ